MTGALLHVLLYTTIGALADATECEWNCYGVAMTTGQVTRYACDWGGVPGCGQPVCSDLNHASAPDAWGFGGLVWRGVRINSPFTEVTVGTLTAAVVTNADVEDDGEYTQVLQWNTSFNVTVVICKAGSSASSLYPFYVYTYLVSGLTSWDDGLVECPEGKAVSHLDFCGVDAGGPSACDVTCDAPPSMGCATVTQLPGTCVASAECDQTNYICMPAGQFVCKYERDILTAGAVCREAAGPCDLAEFCDGNSTTCPDDVVATADTVCRSASLPCDIAEMCDGVKSSCPADMVRPAEEICRKSEGPCDQVEQCDGVGKDCPPDAKLGSETTCREVLEFPGSCDVAEQCDGVANECPPDAGLDKAVVYKCGRDHYLYGGVDMTDFFGGKRGQPLFAGDVACNIGATKTGAYVATGEVTADGCAPATCPNGKALSNAVFGSCIYTQLTTDEFSWAWACDGKKESGTQVVDLCPPDSVVV